MHCYKEHRHASDSEFRNEAIGASMDFGRGHLLYPTLLIVFMRRSFYLRRNLRQSGFKEIMDSEQKSLLEFSRLRRRPIFLLAYIILSLSFESVLVFQYLDAQPFIWDERSCKGCTAGMFILKEKSKPARVRFALIVWGFWTKTGNWKRQSNRMLLLNTFCTRPQLLQTKKFS